MRPRVSHRGSLRGVAGLPQSHPPAPRAVWTPETLEGSIFNPGSIEPFLGQKS